MHSASGRSRRLRGALAVTVALVFAAPAAAPAQQPGLRILTADLRQSAQDLRLRLRFSRELPVRDLKPARGRFACLVLGPFVASRRRVCVSRRGGRLRATLLAIDERGRGRGKASVVRRARIAADGDVLVLRAPARALRVRAGMRVTWQALLRWQDGGPCEAAPGGCIQFVPATGARELLVRRPRRPAFVRAGRLRLLATGDSMIQIVDSFLKRRLERRRATRVRSDARISSGLSKPFLLDWVKRARAQARSLRPDVTAVFVGANDGFSMRTRGGATVPCCRAAWTAEYARRVASMMRSYLRGGRAFVYWLTLPAPRRNDFARVYRSVNRAIERAAKVVGRGARVIDLVRVFTPGGRFRRFIRFRGRTVDARQGDGVHLSTAGASIAATLVVDRLRIDRALPRLR